MTLPMSHRCSLQPHREPTRAYPSPWNVEQRDHFWVNFANWATKGHRNPQLHATKRHSISTVEPVTANCTKHDLPILAHLLRVTQNTHSMASTVIYTKTPARTGQTHGIWRYDEKFETVIRRSCCCCHFLLLCVCQTFCCCWTIKFCCCSNKRIYNVQLRDNAMKDFVNTQWLFSSINCKHFLRRNL